MKNPAECGVVFWLFLHQSVAKLQGNKVIRFPIYLVTLCFVPVFLSSCVTLPDPETSQDFNAHTIADISAGHSVGQSFTSQRAKLKGIDLWFRPVTPTSLKVELFHGPEEDSPIFSGLVNAVDGKTHISIPTRDDPPGQSYYLKINIMQGETEVLGRNEDAYPAGSAFIDDQTINADLAFQTTYEYEQEAVFSDLRGLLSMGDLLLPLGLLLFLPGWLLLDWSSLKDEIDFGERLAIALGLSLAVVPLLMLWTSLIGLHWGRILVWFVAGILVAVLVWRWFRESQETSRRSSITNHKLQIESEQADNLVEENTFQLLRPISHFSIIILIMIFALALFLRFAMIRDLAAPAWVDSIHHGLITRLILESGGIADTYAPYLPTGAEHYHFGYHSILATYIWLIGSEIHTSMLIFGQVLNALMVFPIYLLAKNLTNNRSAGFTAALIVTSFTLMPAYYASWGRYTQLTGLLVLPATFTLIMKILQAKSFAEISKADWLLTTVACAGLFLIHYRVAAFLGMLILAYLLAQVSPKLWIKAIGKLALTGLLIVIFLLPWLPETFVQLLLPTGLKLSGGQVEFSNIPWNFLTPGLGETALILAGIGLVIGIISLKRFPFTLILWTGLLYLAANLGVFAHIPGAGFINPVSIDITLFIPIAILGGFAIGGLLVWFDKFIPVRWQLIPRVIFIALGIGGGILGAQRLLPTLNPITFLARDTDFPAIEWIDENIPTGETILINSMPWGYGLYMGSDGGYWISALSSHPTIPPPVIYGMGKADEINYINETSEAIRTVGENPAALWELMQAENFHFVYTGARGGVISPQALSQSELFSVRYQQDNTWVFEVRGN